MLRARVVGPRVSSSIHFLLLMMHCVQYSEINNTNIFFPLDPIFVYCVLDILCKGCLLKRYFEWILFLYFINSKIFACCPHKNCPVVSSDFTDLMFFLSIVRSPEFQVELMRVKLDFRIKFSVGSKNDTCLCKLRILDLQKNIQRLQLECQGSEN